MNEFQRQYNKRDYNESLERKEVTSTSRQDGIRG